MNVLIIRPSESELMAIKQKLMVSEKNNYLYVSDCQESKEILTGFIPGKFLEMPFWELSLCHIVPNKPEIIVPKVRTIDLLSGLKKEIYLMDKKHLVISREGKLNDKILAALNYAISGKEWLKVTKPIPGTKLYISVEKQVKIFLILAGITFCPGTNKDGGYLKITDDNLRKIQNLLKESGQN